MLRSPFRLDLADNLLPEREERLLPLALYCVITICLADTVLRVTRLPLLAVGVFDLPAHLATTVLLLGALSALGAARWVASREYVRASLLASVLIDLDDVPLLLGIHGTAPLDSRPYTHSLVVAALIALVVFAWRPGAPQLMHGTLFCLLSHFMRDLADGRTVLLWPLSLHPFLMPPWAYWGIMLAAAASIVLRSALARRPRWVRPVRVL